MRRAPLGPVMIDISGPSLAGEEREILAHDLVGGVILFARNFESPQQLRALVAELHALREPPLLIAVDHEGGRVQRFREGFTPIPPMRRLGTLAESDAAGAREAADAIGCILATELVSHGIDFSFAPVLDVDFGASSVIGDRAFSSEAARIADLAGALIRGMDAAGMAGVGKHFPGHGFVRADSHLEVPVDKRGFSEIEGTDLVPYRSLIPLGLGGIMPAHVIYPAVDAKPAGFSEIWLKRVLRGYLGFDGMIFSDDLSMEGAGVAGDIVARAEAAIAAGCDMVLACNAPQEAARLLDRLAAGPVHPGRAQRMRSRAGTAAQAQGPYYAAACDVFKRFFG